VIQVGYELSFIFDLLPDISRGQVPRNSCLCAGASRTHVARSSDAHEGQEGKDRDD
jgi:hypothetical protein